MIDEEQVRKLRERLRKKRQFGLIHFDIQALENYDKGKPKATVDAYVVSLGFAPLGERWITVNGNRAGKIIAILLHHDQAYSLKCMSLNAAKTFASLILSLFPGNKRYYTNWKDGCMPITAATFDKGVVIVDDHNIGIFWVEDED